VASRPVTFRTNIGVVGSNPTRGMDVCECLLCVGSDRLIPRPRSPTYWVEDEQTGKAVEVQQRTVEQ
jgi:hypothetical protein